MCGIMYKVCMIEHSDMEDDVNEEDEALHSETQNDEKAAQVSQPLLKKVTMRSRKDPF